MLKSILNITSIDDLNSLIFESSKDAITLWKPDGSLLIANQTARTELARSGLNLQTVKWFGLPWPEKYAEQAKAVFRSALEGQSLTFDVENALTQRWWSISISPIRGQDHATVYIHVIARDVSDLVQGKNEIAQLLQKNSLQLESINSVLQNYTDDRKPEQCFDRMLEVILQLSGSEYGFIDELFTKENGETYLVARAISNIAWNEESRKMYQRFLTGELTFSNLKSLFGAVMTTQKPVIANDAPRDLRAKGVPAGHPALNKFLGIPLISGSDFVGVVGLANAKQGYNEDTIKYLKPLTQTCANIMNAFKHKKARDDAEIQLKKAQLAAENASQAKSAFLAFVSHEVRSPVGLMMSFAELLNKPNLTDSNRKLFTEKILSNGQLALAIINDLLDLSKAEANKLDLVPIEFDLPSLLTDLVESVRFTAQQKNIEMNLNIHSHVPEKVTADPGRLRQILLNLLSNAIKFTNSGSITIDVDAKVSHPEESNAFLEFAITDSGCGIDSEQKQNLFRPFSQGSATISKKYGGTGLGLCLSKNLAQAMGGNVVLQWTEPGKGSCFVATVFWDRSNRA